MTFPKKGTRTITHEGEIYHWRFGRSHEKGFARILIEKAAVNGQVLSISYPTDIYHWSLDFSESLEVIRGRNYRSAKPEMISNFISQAFDLGWKPDVSMKTLLLNADEDDILHQDKPNRIV